jgi:hypothetical protein
LSDRVLLALDRLRRIIELRCVGNLGVALSRANGQIDTRMIRICVLATGLAATATLIAGCSSGSLESTVSGRVTLDGKAIGPGVTVFAPVHRQGNPATGAIEPNGSYSLKTSRASGLLAGKYQVSVQVREVPKDIQPGDRPPPGKSLIPDKYESSSTSGLEYDVQPGSNTINIELRSN